MDIVETTHIFRGRHVQTRTPLATLASLPPHSLIGQPLNVVLSLPPPPPKRNRHAAPSVGTLLMLNSDTHLIITPADSKHSWSLTTPEGKEKGMARVEEEEEGGVIRVALGGSKVDLRWGEGGVVVKRKAGGEVGRFVYEDDGIWNITFSDTMRIEMVAFCFWLVLVG
eukprot:GFKZ01005686.1.p1 GENE.GFKZ01005686.1~~GFKZ01005686.1.p1  ORF type:complete len:168 (-),score=26.64 GFKZ01005686.1:218-721(-)